MSLVDYFIELQNNLKMYLCHRGQGLEYAKFILLYFTLFYC